MLKEEFKKFVKNSREYEEKNDKEKLKRELKILRKRTDELINELEENTFIDYEYSFRFSGLSEKVIEIEKLTAKLLKAKEYHYYIEDILEENKVDLPDEITDYMNIISKETAIYLYKNNLQEVLFIDDDFQESYLSDIKQFEEYNIFAVDKPEGELK
ncbi:MAG: hypothetical protein ACOCV1_06550 [Bacillota bacterium]